MSNQSTSSFTFSKAKREHTPILAGIVGPSGTGKTFSALRLARGIQRVTGGRIKVIDTEHRRATHYADLFDFDHFDMQPPFSSLRYLAAIQAAAAEGPGPVVVDSLSHEHDGPGGYLEFHEQEVERLVAGPFKHSGEAAANIPAWAKPAEARRKLIQGIIHLGINAIFCFRSKEKLDMNAKDENGKKKVKKLGWMPIAGEAFVYEMTLKCLLLPGSDGVPTWHPEEMGEKAMCKLPAQFRDMFTKPAQLSEDIGEHLARWAAGTSTPSALDTILAQCETADAESFPAVQARGRETWKSLKKAEQAKLKAAMDAAAKRIAEAPTQTPATTDDNVASGDNTEYQESLFTNSTGTPPDGR